MTDQKQDFFRNQKKQLDDKQLSVYNIIRLIRIISLIGRDHGEENIYYL
jgi:hypothetical protein